MKDYKERIARLVERVRQALEVKEEEITLKASRIWRAVIVAHRKKIREMKKNGATNRDIYNVLVEVVKSEFGEEYVISDKAFYKLLTEALKKKLKANRSKGQKENTKEVKEATAGGEKKSLGILEGLEEDIRQALRKDLK